MNLLFITVVFPYPVNDGGRSGTFKMIEFLRANHSITLICPESDKEHLAELKKIWPNVKIVTYLKTLPEPNSFDFKKFVKGFLPKKELSKQQHFYQKMGLNTSSLVNYYFQNLIELAQNEVEKYSFDVIQVDFIELAPIRKFISKNIPTVFVHHELRYRRMHLEYKTIGIKDFSEEWKIENTRVLEVGLLNKFDKVICLTNIDKEILKKDGVEESKLLVSPLPVDIKDHPINIPFKFNNKLVFLGPEVHFPNLDGVDWFITKCWNNLLKINPKLHFSITGKWSEKGKSFFKDYKNIRFEGFVEDLSNIMEGSIMVIPLRIGSGMRMKILEGASWHVPMISTPVGAEGLPMENMNNCIIAESPEDFINGIIQLSKDAELQNKFVATSKKLISTGYSVEECGLIREMIFKDIVKS